MASRSKASHFIRKPNAQQLAVAVAVVSGLFSLIVSVLLIANYLQIKALDPLNHPELQALRKQLADAPNADEHLVQQIRALDLLSRKAFFTSQAHLRVGGRLLVGGVIVFLIALRFVARWNPKMPEPGPPPEPQAFWGSLIRAREFVAMSAVALVVTALIAGQLSSREIPVPPTEPTSTGPTADTAPAPQPGTAPTGAPSFPGPADLELQWPSFRGPGGIGVAHFDTAPKQWDIATSANVRWKAKVPLSGFNSPVVWGNRVFLTGATPETREVYCFDADTGNRAWTKTLSAFPGTPAQPPKVGEDVGHAAPTAVAHGDRVCAIFANGDMICLDFDGNELWGRNLGVPDTRYGYASSLIARDNLVYLQMDDSTNPRLLALDLTTGQEAWNVKRKYISWASPALIPASTGAQLILNSERDVDAYDPRTGALLWTVECLSGEVAPSPAFADDMVFVAMEYAEASALRLDPSIAGPPQIAWQWEDALPEVSSPVGSGAEFYIATSSGDVVCLDHATGKKLWSGSFDEGFYSSPVCVGDRIYVLDREGTMRILRAGPRYEEIASIPFNEPAFATPAFLDKRIYVRTAEHLYCIESDGVR